MPGAVVQVSRGSLDLQHLSVADAGSAVPVAGLSGIAFSLTDDLGRFAIEGLAPGDYRIMVGHKQLMPIKVNGQPLGARVAPPGFVTIEMVGLVGYRVVFPDQVMLSYACMHPRNLNVGYGGIAPVIGRPTQTCALPGQEFEFCGITASAASLKPIVLYALLSKSGPVKITLHAKSASAKDYTMRYLAKAAQPCVGTLRVALHDPSGASIPCKMRWKTATGTPAYKAGARLRTGELPIEELQWEGRLSANEDCDLYRGRYSVMAIDPFLRKLVTSTTVTIAALKTRIVPKRLQVAVGEVTIQLGAKPCRVHLTGVTPLGVTDKFWRLCVEDTVRLWLPEGVYQLKVTRPGHVGQELQFDTLGTSATVALGEWQKRVR